MSERMERMAVGRYMADGRLWVEVRDDEGARLIAITPHAALWLAQHLLRHGRIALREESSLHPGPMK